MAGLSKHIRRLIFLGSMPVLLFAGTVGLEEAVAQAALSSAERGLPFASCHSMKEYNGHFQSWAFAQDNEGLIYVGNTLGVLQFDGTTWRLIPTSNSAVVRSLSADDDGRIYVGSSGDLGFLAPDAVGNLRFESLLPNVADADRDFNDVRTTHATPGGVFFQSWERLFRFVRRPDGTWIAASWTPEGRFLYAFWVNDDYYVHDEGVGLLRLVGDRFELVSGSERFADVRLQVMLPIGPAAEGHLVVGGFNQGLFKYDGSQFTRFATEADEMLTSQGTLYAGSTLKDGSLGLAVLDVGLLVIDSEGRLVHRVSETEGLPSNTIISTFVDASGTVWIAPETGICRIETPSPLTRFDGTSGLSGAIFDITRHDGRLYVSTGDGLFFLDTSAGRFQAVSGLEAGIKQSFGMVKVEGRLLAAVSTGVYEVDGDRATLVIPNVGFSFAAQGLHQSLQDPRRVYAALADGLGSLRLDASGMWQPEGHIPGVHEQLQSIVEPEAGELWLSTVAQGVLRVALPRAGAEPSSVDHFEKASGLVGAVSTFVLDGEPVLVTKDGAFRYASGSESIVRDDLLNDAVSFSGSAHGYSLVESANGDRWVNFGAETALLRLQPDGSFVTDAAIAARIADTPAEAIYVEEDGIVWFGTNDGELVRYDASVPKDYTADYRALVRQVVSGQDSLVFGGSVSHTTGDAEATHSGKALRFDFASTSYENPSQTEYQSRLVGFDEDWSGWSSDTRRYYTNLPPRSYSFEVRARNLYGHPSSDAAYDFAVRPPWFRTWWAYAGYFLAFLAAALWVNGVQDRRLVKRERARAEHERMKNVELLSTIGREVTATLSIEDIINRVYNSVNGLMDASIFGIGIYNENEDRIDFPGTKRKGIVQTAYRVSLDDASLFASKCFLDRTEIVIQDYDGRGNQSPGLQVTKAGDGQPKSLLYIPLVYKEKPVGVITAQSFETNAYGDYEISVLRNLATYTAIAIDNADAYRRLNASLEELKAMQEQLLVQEKLASLGQLTAGIAHEIKNPLNFVNNFAQLIGELADDLEEELQANSDKRVIEVQEDLQEILGHLKTNAEKINEHGQRADGIVRSMLQHSRSDSGERTETDINQLLEEYVNLAYHGAKATNTSFDPTIVRDYDPASGSLLAIPQDIGRVFLNLLNNAFYAVQRRTEDDGDEYQATVYVSTTRRNGMVDIVIRDNGAGIPAAIQDRIFEPFFTTKPTGSGTGLGLSLSYDIVTNAHGGHLAMSSSEGMGAEFTISLPDSAG